MFPNLLLPQNTLLENYQQAPERTTYCLIIHMKGRLVNSVPIFDILTHTERFLNDFKA